LAFKVVVVATVTGPLYKDEDVVGVLPFVVYRIVAPEVEQAIETCWVEVYVPGEGLKLGVATGMVLIVY